jgi:hypothetical protein
MGIDMDRRGFVQALAAAGISPAVAGAQPAPARRVIESFDYQGVTLRPSRWQRQFEHAREFYLGLNEDDILKGFRDAAKLPAPGSTLGGWAARDSGVIFGQWLSALARAWRATGDAAFRDKGARLTEGWAKTLPADGNSRMGTYAYEKMVCGLADMHRYAGHPDAIPLLERITRVASATFSRERIGGRNLEVKWTDGWPQEWYTLTENLYRAYQFSGSGLFREFGDVWLYHEFWDKFADTARPSGIQGIHAYSHVNSFNGAAMAYAVTGDAHYLRILRNGYEYLQNTQCFATGGYGPSERILPLDGALGDSLEIRSDSCETPCCSWAAFKMARYLMEFTGEARYGDWIEKLLYNGIGASLPIAPGGRNFYYADYRIGNGIKVYDASTFTCCSGTYFQNVADYHNLIYMRDAGGLYVNLYVPSDVVWKGPEGEVRLRQETGYPETDTTSLTVAAGSGKFRLHFRVPEWSRGATLAVNGERQNVAAEPGKWASLERAWRAGDRVELRIPLRFQKKAVDPQHPNRAAVMRGPVVLVQEGGAHFPLPLLPEEAALDKWLAPAETPATFRIVPQDDVPVRGNFLPFYMVGENQRYRMYFDPSLRRRLW